MKKFISLALIVITIMALCVCVSAASPTLKFNLSSNKVAVDQTITVTVTLSDCAKVRSIGLTPSYDKSLFTLTKGEWLLKDAVIADFNAQNGDAAIIFDQDKNCNGDIFKFTLKAKKTSVFDLSAITAAIVAKQADNKIIPVTAKSVNVSVVESTQTSQTSQTTNSKDTTVATTTTDGTTAPGETTTTDTTNAADTTVDTQNTPTKETTGKGEATKAPDKDEETKKVVDGGDILGNGNTTLWIIVIAVLIVLAVGIVIYVKTKNMYL